MTEEDEYYFPQFATSAAASFGPVKAAYTDCHKCKKRIKTHEGLLVRTNNNWLPNSDADAWDYQCKDCMTDDQKEELNPSWLKESYL